MDDLIAELEAQGKAPGTVRNIIVPLRSLLNDAVPDHLPSNPAARVNLPPAQDFAGAELSYEETARIRAALEALAPTKANGEPDLIYVHLFDVALGTGLRFGELAALRWRDYDRERTLIRVERAISRRQAKAPKTAAGRRSVPAFPGVVLALRALLVRASETGRWTRDDPIFTTKLGKPLDRSNFGEDVWRPALRKAGLVDGDGKTLYRFHDLRHTCASRLVASGCKDVKLIQTVVGHSNAAILLNRYSHLTDERVTEAATTYDPAVRSAL